MVTLLFNLLLVAMYHTSSAQNTTNASFKGHKVLDVIFKSAEDLKNVLNLGNKFKLDVWNIPHHINDSFHIRVEPEELNQFLQELKHMGLDARIWIDDVESLIEESKKPVHHLQKRASRVSGFNLNAYHSYNEILAFMNDITAARNIDSSILKVGDTWEGRSINALKMSSKTQTLQAKKAIFIDGGIHAREWVAPATVLCFIEELTSKSENSYLLDHLDWYFVPVVNPDGYEYSRDTYRMWRKNRRHNTGGGCDGVDLNRNFEFHWDPDTGGSWDSCSDVYSGAGALSEPESQSLAHFLRTHNQSIEAYLTFHSYGQYWLYPWGYTSDLPSDWKDLESLAQTAVLALWKKHYSIYITGTAKNLLYAAAGGSDDYAKGVAGIKYAYTVELRDTGRHGFVLPESQIQPTCEETWAGVKAFADGLITKENL